MLLAAMRNADHGVDRGDSDGDAAGAYDGGASDDGNANDAGEGDGGIDGVAADGDDAGVVSTD
eukprot:719304-Lingulodinium_polyedra.AAC.1